MNIYQNLYNSGQAFLYVFVSPQANPSDAIMAKRKVQLQQLSDMYAKDKTYTPAQMIDIIRAGIVAKYGKQPELILQIIYDNAKRILTKGISGSYEGLTFDSESNQYYDGSGNAYQLDNAGNIIEKNGVYIPAGSDNTISNPSNIEEIKVSASGSNSFWDDVKSVIDAIVGWLNQLGILRTNLSLSTSTVPTSSDWSKLNTTSTADFSTYLPYVVVAGVIITALTGTKKKAKAKTK
jgi:hypothetical protein